MSIVAGRATGSTGPSESTAATSNDSSREEAADRSASNRARSGGVRHLYIHVPFCAARCGYCDFVTVVGRRDHHRAYVEALLAELALERGNLASKLESVFLGGGTPTFTNHDALVRLLEALPEVEEVTVEANP